MPVLTTMQIYNLMLYVRWQER